MTISVDTLDDSLPESPEGFTVTLGSPSNGGTLPGDPERCVGGHAGRRQRMEATISDDDLPELSIDNASR